MSEIEILRGNHLIDPSLHIWGWEIPVYLFLGGLTAGVMILSALLPRRTEPSRAMRLLPFIAPILLSFGMLALFIDLESKLNVWRFYTAFRITSPMSWGSWILLLIYPASIGLGLARLQWAEAHRYTRLLENANVILGIALGAYTGVLLSTLGARALWGSGLLAPLFLVSGLSTAAALAMLFRVSHEEHETLRRWDIAAITVELILLGLLFADLATGGSAGRVAARMFLGGPYTALFWSLVVIGGLALPLTLEIFEARRRLRPTLVTSTLLLAGGLALRWIFVVAGQARI